MVLWLRQTSRLCLWAQAGPSQPAPSQPQQPSSSGKGAGGVPAWAALLAGLGLPVVAWSQLTLLQTGAPASGVHVQGVQLRLQLHCDQMHQQQWSRSSVRLVASSHRIWCMQH